MFTGGLWTDLLCILVALCVCIYTYSKFWIYQTFKKKSIPYFEPTFPFGNLSPPYKGIPSYLEVCNIAQRARAKGWDYFGMYLTLNSFFVPVDLDLIKCILTKDFNNFVDRGTYFNEKDDPLSANLTNAEGQKWKNLRRKLTPTFSSGKMKGMFPTLTDTSSVLEQALEEYIGREPIDIRNILIKYTQDVIGSIAFGIECNSFKETETPFQKYFTKLFERNSFGQFADLLSAGFPEIARALHYKVFSSDISKFFFDVIRETKSYREKNNINRNDFLQLLLDSKSKPKEQSSMVTDGESEFTENEIVAQCFIFFFGGFETTATTMTFALYEISRHPEVQEKIREELFKVMKKHDNEISYEILNELEYLQQVLDETLRKYPVIPMVTRRCVRDYKIPNTNIILKKGTNILIPTIAIHLDETIYENPDKFDPDRFSPKNRKNRHPYAHLPFGEGPRSCIGMRFGLMESKLTLTKILSKFSVSLNAKTTTPLELDPKNILLKPQGSILLNFEKVFK